MTGGPTLARTREELAAALAAQAGTRAVVMTMGALHAGHLSLVHGARAQADCVVVTIFVNPLQFGPSEDLAAYPRDLEHDLAALAGPGLLDERDVVFAPGVEQVYPDGEPAVRVSAGRLGTVLEGAARPGHLDGVLTVVLKLVHLTRPDVALFGRKDAQQLAAVHAMVRDLDLPVRIVGMPIIRDDDALALSSRNAYLSTSERRDALALSRALAAAVARAAAGGPADEVRAAAAEVLAAEPGVVVDYLALVAPMSFEDVDAGHAGPALLTVAARVGRTRLIDNVELTLLA